MLKAIGRVLSFEKQTRSCKLWAAAKMSGYFPRFEQNFRGNTINLQFSYIDSQLNDFITAGL